MSQRNVGSVEQGLDVLITERFLYDVLLILSLTHKETRRALSRRCSCK